MERNRLSFLVALWVFTLSISVFAVCASILFTQEHVYDSFPLIQLALPLTIFAFFVVGPLFFNLQVLHALRLHSYLSRKIGYRIKVSFKSSALALDQRGRLEWPTISLDGVIVGHQEYGLVFNLKVLTCNDAVPTICPLSSIQKGGKLYTTGKLSIEELLTHPHPILRAKGLRLQKRDRFFTMLNSWTIKKRFFE